MTKGYINNLMMKSLPKCEALGVRKLKKPLILKCIPKVRTIKSNFRSATFFKGFSYSFNTPSKMISLATGSTPSSFSLKIGFSILLFGLYPSRSILAKQSEIVSPSSTRKRIFFGFFVILSPTLVLLFSSIVLALLASPKIRHEWSSVHKL